MWDPWGGMPPWGHHREDDEKQLSPKVIPLEDLARRNNRYCTLQNVHDGWILRWGNPEQMMALRNRFQLHEAIDVFAGTDPEKRKHFPSELPEDLQGYEKDEEEVEEWREFASELAACIQSCYHGMNANHPARPMADALLSKARRKGIV